MGTLLWLTVCVPLAASLLVRISASRAPAVAVISAAAATALAAGVLLDAGRGREATSTISWLPGGGLDVGLRLDGLSAAMSATVAAVGLVVIVYSVGYFAADPRRPTALAWLLAFLGAMQGLVLADGYLALLIFWELVGATSARLIAHNRQDPAAAPAAVRAFLTTRTADIGFYIAVLALFAATGSLAFDQSRPSGTLGTLAAIGLIVAAIGKSAQVPLQTWLAAAMAGPTPVSALLHSATMVAAGVYLIVRSLPLLAGWPLQAVGWIGAITAVAAAAIALAQRDLKRVLAGSTASQLGLMFVGAAAGGPAVALFHLIAHAAGKAGLFLATGVLQHQRGSVELDQLRGSGRDDRATFAAFAICALSIAAVPPLAAFWSKDHIAAAAQPHTAWFILTLISAAGSAAYLLRPALILWDRRGARPTQRPPGRRLMLGAVAVMAAASLADGLLGAPLVQLLGTPPLPTSALSLTLGLLALAAGAVAVLAHVHAPARLAAAARQQLYTDRLQRCAIQQPVLLASRLLDGVETRLLQPATDAVGSLGRSAARASDRVERDAIDAAIDKIAAAVLSSGDDTRRLQSGRLYEYLRDAVLGAIAIGVIIGLAAVL